MQLPIEEGRKGSAQLPNPRVPKRRKRAPAGHAASESPGQKNGWGRDRPGGREAGDEALRPFYFYARTTSVYVFATDWVKRILIKISKEKP